MRYLRHWIGLLIGLCMLAGSLSSAYAQDPSITLEQYIEILRTANAAAQRNDAIGYTEAVQPLTSVTTIVLPNEQTLPFNPAWLTEPAAQASPNLKSVQNRIGATLEALTSARQSTPQDLEKLAAFINSFPYDYDRPREEQISLPSSSSVSLSSLFSQNCLFAMAILLLVVVAIYVAAIVRKNWVKSPQRRVKTAEREMPFVPAGSSTKAIQQADRRAEDGDFRTGVRYLYMSTILWLAEQRVLAFDRTLTNREVLAAVPPNSPLRSRLAPVVQTFDEVWYGFHEIDQAAFDRFRQQVTTLREGRS